MSDLTPRYLLDKNVVRHQINGLCARWQVVALSTISGIWRPNESYMDWAVSPGPPVAKPGMLRSHRKDRPARRVMLPRDSVANRGFGRLHEVANGFDQCTRTGQSADRSNHFEGSIRLARRYGATQQ